MKVRWVVSAEGKPRKTRIHCSGYISSYDVPWFPRLRQQCCRLNVSSFCRWPMLYVRTFLFVSRIYLAPWFSQESVIFHRSRIPKIDQFHVSMFLHNTTSAKADERSNNQSLRMQRIYFQVCMWCFLVYIAWRLVPYYALDQEGKGSAKDLSTSIWSDFSSRKFHTLTRGARNIPKILVCCVTTYACANFGSVLIKIQINPPSWSMCSRGFLWTDGSSWSELSRASIQLVAYICWWYLFHRTNGITDAEDSRQDFAPGFLCVWKFS